jgi:hypothetical protein
MIQQGNDGLSEDDNEGMRPLNRQRPDPDNKQMNRELT